MKQRRFFKPAYAMLRGIFVLGLCGCGLLDSTATQEMASNLHRAKVFLAAGDYRQAIEACQKETTEHPSARSYLYLAYVYQALDAYVESLAREDRWVLVEQLARSLSAGRPDELLDSPDVLARIAKELIQESSRKRFDVAAEMAMRLDEQTGRNVWSQQTRWRESQPQGWWFGVPPEWGW